MKNLKSLAIIILMITTIIILSTKVEATTGTINSETVRVRSEANTKSNIVAQLDKDQKVEILEQSEGWYKVSFSEKGEKVTGYISESLIDLEKGKVEKQEENTTTEPKQEETEQPQQVEENIEKEEPRTDEVSTIIEENKEYKINQAINQFIHYFNYFIKNFQLIMLIRLKIMIFLFILSNYLIVNFIIKLIVYNV